MSGLRPALIVAILVLVGFTSIRSHAQSTADEIDGVPVPADAAAAEAASSAFAGTWIGKWDEFLKTVLIVEDVAQSGQAKVVYAVADNPGFGLKRAWFRFDATVSGDQMTVHGSGFSLTLNVSPTGRLRAVFGDGLSFAILSRRNLADLRAGGKNINWSAGEQSFLATDLTGDGRPVKLETLVFKPEGTGPFPLAVVNHGSTGAGTDPSLFGETWSNDWFADVLNQRGWMVAFPQRRGRGQSDGTYDEGFSADRWKGYSCDTKTSLKGADRAAEDLHAAVTALRKRPDVSDHPVLLAGQSRGGMLSIAYAGRHPKHIAGVVNFVGGWMGELCENAAIINQTLSRQGAGLKTPTLWVYGADDLFYSIDHSQKNFLAFVEAGGTGSFEEVAVRGRNNGHWVMAKPPLWEGLVGDYLDRLAANRD